LNEYRENHYDKIDRILCDWVFPLGGFAILIVVIIWPIRNFS